MVAPSTPAAPAATSADPDARALTLYNLHRPQVIADPWPYYRRLHAAGLWFDPYLRCWLAPRHAQVTAALGDARFTTAMRHETRLGRLVAGEPTTLRALRLLDRHVSFVDGADHTRLRAALAGPLRPGQVRLWEDVVADIVAATLDQLTHTSNPDIVRDLAAPVPLRVIRHLLGLERVPLQVLRRWSTTWGDVIAAPGHLPTTGRAAAMATVDEMLATLTAVLADHRRDHRWETVTGALVRAAGDGTLTDDELLANLMMLVTAGNETTTNLISNAILALIQHPDLWQRLAADPTLLPAAIEELARAYPPTQYTARTALEDVRLDGHTIRAGQAVVLVLAAANHDPDTFADPDTIRLDRPPSRGAARPVSFGSGPHGCFGAPLATLETRLVLAGLLRQGRPVLAGPPRWRRNGNLRGLHRLPVRLPAPASTAPIPSPARTSR